MTASTLMAAAGRTLIIGSTGFIGRFVAEACLASGRPTYLLVRSGLISPSKSKTIKCLHDKGAIVIHGSINDQELMEKLLRENKIEVVISAVGGASILDQLVLIDAIKASPNVKRFLPSEFGHDIDRANPVEPGLTMYNEKRKVRRCIEEIGIPYTYICCNSIAAWPYHDNTHPADVLPPLDRFQIYGDGSVKAYFVTGTDIGKFTIKTLDDVRTINKSIHFRPPSNYLNINELATLWEGKIRRTLPRVTVTEDDLLAAAKEMRIPESIVASFTHDIFIKGCQINFSIDKPTDVDVSSLYPELPFLTMDECFDEFLKKIVETPKAIEKVAEEAEGEEEEEVIAMKKPRQETFISAIADKKANEEAIPVPPSTRSEALAITA
ncbi:NmrA-like domain [Dillenia turbinata]|uniref:NmrA-like domain n=1 Tax=Dillenia turbinata TaxID=194707 RepID=A0AAN8UQ43_9MAGN